MSTIEEYVKERNELLLELNKEKIILFCKKYGIPVNENDLVFWTGVHKARCEVESFPEEVKLESREWLKKNGFKEGIGR